MKEGSTWNPLFCGCYSGKACTVTAWAFEKVGKLVQPNIFQLPMPAAGDKEIWQGLI